MNEYRALNSSPVHLKNRKVVGLLSKDDLIRDPPPLCRQTSTNSYQNKNNNSSNNNNKFFLLPNNSHNKYKPAKDNGNRGSREVLQKNQKSSSSAFDEVHSPTKRALLNRSQSSNSKPRFGGMFAKKRSGDRPRPGWNAQYPHARLTDEDNMSQEHVSPRAGAFRRIRDRHGERIDYDLEHDLEHYKSKHQDEKRLDQPVLRESPSVDDTWKQTSLSSQKEHIPSTDIRLSSIYVSRQRGEASKECAIGSVAKNVHNCTLQSELSPTTTTTASATLPASTPIQRKPLLAQTQDFSELANILMRDLDWSSSSGSGNKKSTGTSQPGHSQEAHQCLLDAPAMTKFHVPKAIYVRDKSGAPEINTEQAQPDDELDEDKFLRDIVHRIHGHAQPLVSARAPFPSLDEKKRAQLIVNQRIQKQQNHHQQQEGSPKLLRAPSRPVPALPLQEVILPPPLENGDDDGCSAITEPDYGSVHDFSSFAASDYSLSSMEFQDVD